MIEPREFINGYRVFWHHWRQPATQLGLIGCWSASSALDEPYWYATTTGVVAQGREMEVLDLSLQPGWPSPLDVELMTEDEREAVKTRAHDALVAVLA